MQSRLKSSKKWSDLPKEFTHQVREVFTENFKSESQRGHFLVDGRIYPDELILRVGYLPKGRIKQANMEISVNLSPEDQVLTKLNFCVDAAGSLFSEYFEAEKGTPVPPAEEVLDLPLSWKEIPFAGQNLYLQFTTENMSLEDEANRILGELPEDGLLKGDMEESEDLSNPPGKKLH